MMKVSKRQLGVFGAIAIGALLLITLLFAPLNNKLNSGSTYSRSPDGYGAWYTYMSERGTPIQRWQKPFNELVESKEIKPPMTLLRIYSKLISENELNDQEENWVKRGNQLILLGIYQPVTQAPFSTQQNRKEGTIKIDTRRRFINENNPILGDQFGAVIWEQKIGNGQVVFVTTPYLAANAYQDFTGNYELLAQLVTQEVGTKNDHQSIIKSTPKKSPQIWVDEYIHGYKDKEVIKKQIGENLFSYLIKKPLFCGLLQGLIILLVTIWAANHRFGKPVTLTTPIVDNSQAYMNALGGVLQKAGSRDFILDIVGKEEQQQLQKALGLGQIPRESDSLVQAWVKQTGKPATELQQLLQQPRKKRRITDTQLLSWLSQWKAIKRDLH